MRDPVYLVCDDAEALAHKAAEWLVAAAIAQEGRFAIALSGGSTPMRFYQLLAEPPHLAVFPWDRVHWFWGDERFVPHDDAQSNYRMAREALLSKAPVPAANIHPIATENMSPDAAASLYERDLKSFYGAETLDPARPLFNAVILGLGRDGHTASLFPGSPALEIRDRWAAPVVSAAHGERITLTYPALESSARTAFLVVGSDKHAVFDDVRRGNQDFPAARLRPSGELTWFLDKAAAVQSA